MAAAPFAALRSILIASSFKPMILSRIGPSDREAGSARPPHPRRPPPGTHETRRRPPTASSAFIRAAQDPQRGLAGLDRRNAFAPRRPREPSRPAQPFQHRLRNRRFHRLARGLRRAGKGPRRPAAGAAEEPDLDGPALSACPLGF